MELSTLCLIAAFGPVSIMCLKSLYRIEDSLRSIQRKGTESRLDLGAEKVSDDGGDHAGDGEPHV